MVADAPFDVLRTHRWFAVEFNNAAWEIIEAAECSAEDQQRLKHLAHAACLHWSHTGTALNRLRALCLLANVYSRVGPASEAVNFARQTVALSEQEPDGQSAFDRATAYECLSRALTASGATEEARCVRQRAVELAGLIEDSEERAVFDKLSFGDWRG